MRKVANLYGGDRSISPDDWAANVMNHLYADNVNTTFVRELASYYLTHLLVACKRRCSAIFLWPVVTEFLLFYQSEILQVLDRPP